MKNYLHLNEPIVIGSLDSDPVVGVNGALYYNKVLNVFRKYESGTWSNVSSTSAMAAAQIPFSDGSTLVGSNFLRFDLLNKSLHIADTSSDNARVVINNEYNNQPLAQLTSLSGESRIYVRSANGNSSPTALNIGDKLLSFIVDGYNGTAYSKSAEISVVAAKNFSGTNQGSNLRVLLTSKDDTFSKSAIRASTSALILGGGYQSANLKSESSSDFSISTADLFALDTQETGDGSPVTDGNSGNLIIRTGATTGAGISGDVLFKFSSPNTSGSNTNAPSEKFRLKSTGVLNFSSLASDPSSNSIGDLYYNSTDSGFKYYNGTSWQSVGAVTSVNSQTGAVSLTTDSIPEGVTNLYFTDSRAKSAAVINSLAGSQTDQAPSVNSVNTALSSYAPLASPSLTGVPTAPTAAANTNTTQLATTAFVSTAITNLGIGNYLKLDGTSSMTGNLNLGSHNITNVGAINTTGIVFAGGLQVNHGIIDSSLGGPSFYSYNTDSVYIATGGNYATTGNIYIQTGTPTLGGTKGSIYLSGTSINVQSTAKIINLLDPTAAQDAATKNYVDTSISTATSTAANKTLSNLTGPTAINVNLLPSGSVSLGNSSTLWTGVYTTGIYSPPNQAMTLGVTSLDQTLSSGGSAISRTSVGTTTLNPSVATPTQVGTFAFTGWKSGIVNYRLIGGPSNYGRTGSLYVCVDPANNTSIADNFVDTGVIGVVFTLDYNVGSGIMSIQYTNSDATTGYSMSYQTILLN